MHLSPTPAYFVVKIEQLHRALSHDIDFDHGLLYSLDLSSTASENAAVAVSSPLMQVPKSVTTRVQGPEYITDNGVEAIDVSIHCGTPDGGGKSVNPYCQYQSAMADEDRKHTVCSGCRERVSVYSPGHCIS